MPWLVNVFFTFDFHLAKLALKKNYIPVDHCKYIAQLYC